MTKRIIRIALDVLALLILIGTILFLIVYWKHIPDMIPTHYNAKGEIDGWGGKASLLLLPVLSAFLYIMLSFSKMIRFRFLRKEIRVLAPEFMFPLLKLVLTASFAYMTICGAAARPLGLWFLPVFLVLTLLPLIVFSVLVWQQR